MKRRLEAASAEGADLESEALVTDSPQKSTAIISVQHVSVIAKTPTTTASEQGKVLLSDVSLELQPNTIHVILGPNGAGKSTLVKVASGLLSPSNEYSQDNNSNTTQPKGKVLIKNTPMSQFDHLSLSLQRAVLPQLEKLSFPLSVREMVSLGRNPVKKAMRKGLIQATSRELHRAIVDCVMRDLDITHLSHRMYHTLSGGEQQRVQLARVLAQQTPAIILDEPLSALDIAHQHYFMTVLQRLVKRAVTEKPQTDTPLKQQPVKHGTVKEAPLTVNLSKDRCVLIVLHDINMALRYADEITLLHQGCVYAQGKTQNVITEQALADVYGLRAKVAYDEDIRALQIKVQ